MITGQEAALKALLKTEIEAAVTANCGAAPLPPNCIIGLAEGIANALIPFLVTNIVVNSANIPASGIVDSHALACNGNATSDPGTIA